MVIRGGGGGGGNGRHWRDVCGDVGWLSIFWGAEIPTKFVVLSRVNVLFSPGKAGRTEKRVSNLNV